jgi:ribosome-binding factor A
MEAATPRQNKIAKLIQRELSEMFQMYAKDWLPGKMLTVTSVRVSPDLSLAKCYLSVFPSESSKEVLEHLKSNISEVRFQLGKRVRNQLRKIPEIALFIDDSLDYIENIENILKK